MEQQILKAINRIKYISKKGVTITSLGETIYAKCNIMAKFVTNSKS